jgi:hypothetical protein
MVRGLLGVFLLQGGHAFGADPWMEEIYRDALAEVQEYTVESIAFEEAERETSLTEVSPAPPSPEAKAPNWIEFSGHAQSRYESRQNYDFIYSRDNVDGQPDNDDNFLLTRIRASLDLRPNPFVQAHFTFQDAQEFGSHQLDHDALDRRGNNIFENETDLHEAWLKLKLGHCPMWIQAGRMQLNYGDQRLIGGFNWANTARNFDAVKLIYEKDNFKLDLVAANVVVVDSNAWDDSDDDDNLLFAYATLKDLPQGLQDVYWIYRDNDETEREIHTVGTRIAGAAGAVDWNLEGAYQFGSSIDTVNPIFMGDRYLNHEAFATHAELGYTCPIPNQLRLAAGYDFATGDDDPNDSENNTFDNLFPTNHLFYGYMDFFSWRNLHNPYIKLSWVQTEKLKIRSYWHSFWLDEESSDAWYNAGGGIVRNAAGANAGDFVGHEFDIVASYSLTKKLNLELGYGHFFADNYIADSSPGGRESDDADFFYLQTVWTF